MNSIQKTFFMILKYLRKKTKASKSPEEKEADREKSNEIDNENLQTDKNRCGRRGRRQNRSIDEKFELVKIQCGRHRCEIFGNCLLSFPQNERI
jgi:hypothetical protein